MKCSLEKMLLRQHNHEEERKQMLGGSFVKCPLLDKQICLWCCLHIKDQAAPMTKVNASERFKDYQSLSPETLRRTWDEVWSVCAVCSK